MRADIMIWLKGVNHSDSNNISQINFICSIIEKDQQKLESRLNWQHCLEIHAPSRPSLFIYFPADCLFILTLIHLFLLLWETHQMRNDLTAWEVSRVFMRVTRREQDFWVNVKALERTARTDPPPPPSEKGPNKWVTTTQQLPHQ